MTPWLQAEGWDVTLAQLHRHRGPPRSRRHQPHPRGVLRPGSATEAVLAALQGRHWRTEGDLVEATGRTRSAVTCALQALRAAGLVQAQPGPQRQGALVYRAGRQPAELLEN